MMAKIISIIRYKFKADRDFESVQFEGMSCSLGELKRLILDKSSRTGTHHPKDDYDLTIKDAMIDKEYKDYNELIPRNTSVIVTRRIRGSVETLTTSSYQKPVDTTSAIVNEYLRPVILPTETSNQTEEISEDERIKKMLEDSKLKYLPGSRANFVPTCHNCRQTGHLRNQCPLILQQNNNTNGTTSSSSSVPPPPSRIITTQAPYQMSNHHHHHHHHYHRHRYPRVDIRPKNPTGLPKNDLIQIPRHIPGAFRDQTGASVVPIGVARMLIEDSQKKADALVQRTRTNTQEKNFSTTKINESENPPDDLVCPICKEIFRDAVITPCCHQNFCDECIRNALLESDDLECPQCHRQSVAIDEINPHLLLRKHVERWREEQQQKKSTFSYATIPNQISSTTYDETSANSEDFVQSEFDFHSSMSQQQPTALVSIPTGPIVIKMQTSTQSVSSPIVNTQPADVTFENDKAPETDPMTTNEAKELNDEKSPKNSENSLTINDILSSVNSSETEKSSRQTPPSQVAPVSTLISSPSTAISTNISGTASLVPHHSPSIGSHLHHPYLPSQTIPSATTTTLYPMASNYYGSPIHLPYPGAPPHHHLIAPPSLIPVGTQSGLIPHYTGYPPYPGIPPTHHPIALTHLSANPMNAYHLSPYDTTNVTDFHHSATSTLISHHHHQSVTPLSRDEFYTKKRDFRRSHRSSSAHRSRSSSPSSSSSGSNHSRNDSRRHHNRHRSDRHRRSSRSRTTHRHQSRHRSPSSSSTRRRDRPPSKQRRISPQVSRSTRDRERRRSPRPPPTIQQSTQRTIVYSHESSMKTSSSRDDRKAPSSKVEQQSQSESIRSSSPMIVPSDQHPSTLASTIQTVNDDNYSDKNRKRKKDYHDEKDYRRERIEYSHSRNRQHRSSEDRSIKSRKIDDNSTSIPRR